MEAPVSVFAGAMNSLLAKLATAEDAKLKGAHIDELKGELGAMRSHLHDFALARAEPTVQAKQWMRQAREIVYDIEDWVDDFRRRADSEAEHAARGLKGMAQRVKIKLASKDEITKQIKDFTTRIKVANDRYKRYELKRTSSITGSGGAATTSNVPVDSRLPELHADEIGLVGIDLPRDKLIDSLLTKDGTAQKLMVSAIVGFGGLGKTTLAKQVYLSLQRNFDCRAFLRAGRNPCVKTLLVKMLNQVDLQRHQETESSWDEQKLIDELSKFLTDKKYLVLIDDVWSTTVWQVIKCALPDGGCGSRIMITTRIPDVATSSCINQSDHIHEMERLDAEQSKTLLLRRVFGPGKHCPSRLEKVSANILERCAGVPLNITVIASLLASKETLEKWESVDSAINSHEDVQGAKKILHHCYTELPHHLKSCLLYLSVFPEDYVIQKDRLIRRWISEGFISETGGETLQETGESCLKELLNRGLIQPVSTYHSDEETCFTVHDMIHDLIVSLSIEENFVTVPAESINIMPYDKIRRLSLQYSNHEVAPTIPSSTILSHLWSLTIFGHDEGMPQPTDFQYLRVLDLEDSKRLEYNQIESTPKLFHLRYLGLKADNISKLPDEVGNLQSMETLDVRGTKVRELPANIVGLRKLMYLLVDNAKLPDGMGKMEDLHELSMINVDKSYLAKSLAELGELKNLRTLGVKWSLQDGDSSIAEYEQNLVSVLNKLSNFKLKSLSLDAEDGSSLNFLVDGWPLSEKLVKFRLISPYFYFRSVPPKMVTLRRLTYLEIAVQKVEHEELKILRDLKALIILKLRSGASTSKRCIIDSVGFTCLQEFWFMCCREGITTLEFQEGAMGRVRRLRLQFHVQQAKALHGAFPLGVQFLSSLKHFGVMMDCEGAKLSEVKAAEASIRQAFVAAEDAIKRAVDPAFQFELGTHHEDKMIKG